MTCAKNQRGGGEGGCVRPAGADLAPGLIIVIHR